MMVKKSKRAKSELKEDRISDLPDCLIQHILSFLPTTKQAIQTTVLSKRWHNQWTGVPVLIFNSNGKFCQNVLEFHNCSKIEKLHCDMQHSYLFDEIVSFALGRHVEDLELKDVYWRWKVLPEIFFDNISVVKLGMRNYDLMPKGKVNWASIKELNLNLCSLTIEAIEHILCGSPLLELISLSSCRGFDKFVVTSKYLKVLVLEHQELGILEISCPSLRQLSFCDTTMKDGKIFGQVIQNVLSVSTLLESLKLVSCKALGHLTISSETLKILVIEDIRSVSCLQVSCSKLEKLEFNGILNFRKVEFMNLPSSVRVYLDDPHQGDTMTSEIRERLIKDSLQQLHHVNELKLGGQFIKVLPGLPGDWSATEDKLLADYIKIHGEGNWRNIPKNSDLQRCGKSCMLRWRNCLRPGRNLTNDEEDLIIRLHNLLGDRWSLIAGRLRDRTDDEIKTYWNKIIWKKLQNKKKQLNRSRQPKSDR